MTVKKTVCGAVMAAVVAMVPAVSAQTTTPQVGHGPTQPTAWSPLARSPLVVSRIGVIYADAAPDAPIIESKADSVSEASSSPVEAHRSAPLEDARSTGGMWSTYAQMPGRQPWMFTRPESARFQLLQEEYIAQPDGRQFAVGTKVWTVVDKATGQCHLLFRTLTNS